MRDAVSDWNRMDVNERSSLLDRVRGKRVRFLSWSAKNHTEGPVISHIQVEPGAMQTAQVLEDAPSDQAVHGDDNEVY